MYIRDKNSRKFWSARTHTQVGGTLKILHSHFGEVDLNTLKHADMMDFRDNVLMKIPSRMELSLKFKGKTLKQIIRIAEEEKLNTLDTTTVNNSLNRVSTFFGWASKNDYIRKNIASGLFVRDDLREDEERPVYSKEDLVKILKALKEFSDDEKAYKYWVPLIALTSGMRQKEICQLYVSDIIKVDGVLCYNIFSKDENIRVKTKSSKRIVPIHPILIKIGLLKYIKMVKDAGHTVLWYNLKPKNGDYGQRFQRFYSKFNRKIVTKESKKVFYSFRHTFSNNLKQHDVNFILIGELLGHANKSVTARYTKRYEPKTYLEEIKKLDYGINIVKILTT